MSLVSAVAESPRDLVERHRGRLVAVARRGRRNWRIIAECLGMIALSCCILGCGAMIGFYSNQGVFDAQSQRFAGDSLKVLIAALNAPAAPDPVGTLSVEPRDVRKLRSALAIKGCFGRARLELFNPSGFVFANYVCEVDVNDGLLLANMGLRRDPDAWKITTLYVNDPTTSRP